MMLLPYSPTRLPALNLQRCRELTHGHRHPDVAAVSSVYQSTSDLAKSL